jgi:hypothetical protein
MIGGSRTGSAVVTNKSNAGSSSSLLKKNKIMNKYVFIRNFFSLQFL